MENIFIITRVGILAALACIFGLQIYACFDLLSFEKHYLLALIGIEGVLIALVINSGLACYFIALLFSILKIHRIRFKRATLPVYVVSAVSVAWVADWIILEQPLSASLYTRKSTKPQSEANSRGELSILQKSASNVDNLAIMYDRIVVNRPSIYSNSAIDNALAKYSAKYDIEPSLLFYWFYLDSFYGEAASGRIPFFREMTGETFRDLVQVHLPVWFVESPIRRHLVNSKILTRFFGDGLGNKLRYALQKATYDISMEPYEANTFTDAYLIIDKYPDEFDDILNADTPDPLSLALRESYFELKRNGFTPCPSSSNPDTSIHQDNYGAALVKFARALYYKTIFDLDFATRTQFLVAKHIDESFEAALGSNTWSNVSNAQKISLSAMVRDVYVPNIGRASVNPYNLPEFNCAPLEYVINESIKDKKILVENTDIWTPKEKSRLWAAATKKLKVLSEVVEVIDGKPLPGVKPTETVQQSLEVVHQHTSKQHTP